MNKIILATIVAIFSSVAFSQEEAIKVGARLGYQMQSPGEKELDMGFLGFGAGIKAFVPISSNISFAPELNFLYRQLFTIEASYYDEYEDVTYKREADLTEFAISIPLMLQFNATEDFYLAAGLQLDIPFSTKHNIEEDGDSRSRDIDDRSSIDFGIPLGIGFFVNENIALDLRAVIGLTDVIDKDIEDNFSFNQFGLGITYFFM